MVSRLMEVIKIGLQKKIKATWVKQGGTLDRLYAGRSACLLIPNATVFPLGAR